MPAYTAEYYTLSDGHRKRTFTAPDPNAALEIAKAFDDIDLFAKFEIYRSFTGENKTMTTPTATPDKMTAQELRAAFAEMEKTLLNQNKVINTMRGQIEELIFAFNTMREGLQTATAHPAPASITAENPLEIVTMTKITRTRTNGKWYYKMLGGKYMKRGVTIWSEGLEALQLDPASIAWKDDDSFTFEKPITTTVQMRLYNDQVSGDEKLTPQKVIGKA